LEGQKVRFKEPTIYYNNFLYFVKKINPTINLGHYKKLLIELKKYFKMLPILPAIHHRGINKIINNT
jgi:hypothetical protein